MSELGEARAIPFTRRTYKELVDGTLRVQIDIEPRHKADFQRLFPEVDMPGAMTPLLVGQPTLEPAKPGRDNYPERAGGWKSMGPLCQSAVLLCAEPMFQRFVSEMTGVGPEAGPPDETAADYLKAYCGITSRKELDGDEHAAEQLKGLMAEYRKWNGQEVER